MTIFNRTASATGLTVTTAAPQRIVARSQPTDTGLSVSDTLGRQYAQATTDTGLTVTDSLVSGRIRVRSITTTGLSLSVALRKSARKALTDTGLSVTDSIHEFIPVADTGLAITDSIRKVVAKNLTDAGLTVADSLGKILLTDIGLTIADSLAAQRVVPRPVTDTGLSFSDSITLKAAKHFPSDQGLTFTDDLVARKNGGNVSIAITTLGLTVTATARVLVGRSGMDRTDQGLSLTDGIIITVNGGPPNSCTTDFRRFLLDLDASPEYATWCAANTPGDCNTWTTYVAAILGGGTPAPPSMSTAFGMALADAGIIALEGIVPCRAKPPPTRSPKAEFTFAVSGLTVAFTNTSVPGASGLFDSWLWTFGDGDTDTSTWNPDHTYAGAGTYTVTLTVVGFDSDGISSVSHPVTVFIPSTTGIHIDAVAP
jgi:hypothetical protein